MKKSKKATIKREREREKSYLKNKGFQATNNHSYWFTTFSLLHVSLMS